MNDKTCPICKDSSNNTMQDDMQTWVIHCKKCRIYTLSDDLLFTIEDFDKTTTERQRKNASYFLRKQRNYTINNQNIQHILSLKTPSFQTRYQNLLLALEQECEHMGEEIVISEEKYDLIESVWAFNFDEFMEFITYLESEKYIKIGIYLHTAHQGDITITPKGWAHIEEIKNINPKSSQGFVAMWFKPEMTKIYDEAIAPAIIAAGYSPLRIDKHEHNKDITDEIIAQIRRSKFLVSDYTGHRGGVYYEAGFARGLGLEVFMTCRKDSMEELHFDVNHRICIEWTEDNLPDLKKQLANKIEATLGRGPIIHDA